MLFNSEKRPKTGNVRRLWEWYRELYNHYPRLIYVNRPGYHQRSAGTPNYTIEDGTDVFNVWDVEHTIQLTREEVEERKLHYTSKLGTQLE